MTQNDRITLVIEGLTEDEGRVRLNAFLAGLQNLSSSLNRLDRETAGPRQGSSFQIVELSYHSPVRITLTPMPVPNKQFSGTRVVSHLSEVAQALSNEQSLMSFDSDLLEDFRNLAKPVGKNVKSVTLVINDYSFDLTDRTVTQVNEALAVEDECGGSLSGMLEQINLHGGANVFHIYPEVGPRRVTCHFPPKLLDDAVIAVGKRVEVFGTLKFRGGAPFPHQVSVTEIDAFPPDYEIPDWNDLRGRAPDATGDLSSEAFIAELRDAWV
jgi:hypothetical protein